jgi:hypothetical protein
VFRSHPAPIAVNKRYGTSGQRRKPAAFVEVDVGFPFEDDFVAGARMRANSDGVRHGS